MKDKPLTDEQAISRMKESYAKEGLASYFWTPPSAMKPWFTTGTRAFPSSPEWQGVDKRFEEVSAKLSIKLYLILTEESAYDVGHNAYIFLEPFGDVVITLAPREQKVCVWADYRCWYDEFAALEEEVECKLKENRVFDALICTIDMADKILSHRHPLPIRPKP